MEPGTKIGPLGLEVGQRARRSQTVTAREVDLYAQMEGECWTYTLLPAGG
ncbi:MAG TPA: hypothetical protein VLK35_14180 [Methylomirabilota bacterium]|nr:hypothetical protein [Methylomirabilota bacterium]